MLCRARSTTACAAGVSRVARLKIQGPCTWLWIGVDDADVLFAEFSAKGAHIRSPPQNFSWAYEFAVEDPDGHVLRFGAEPKP